MKQIVIMFAFIAFSTLSLAQRSSNWTIGTSISSSLLNDDRLTLTKVSIEPGFEWNERIYVNLGLGYAESLNNSLPDCENFRGYASSLSVFARLLDPSYKFSPLIGVEMGNIFYSNAKGAVICRDFTLSDNTKNEVMGTFCNFRYLAKMKFMLDIQLIGLNFRFGSNYNVSAVRMYEVRPDEDYSNVLHGFGVEVGLLYTIKTKKNSRYRRY